MQRLFMFPGQGSQQIGMAKEFYDNFSYVREIFELVNDTVGRDIGKIMFEGPIELLTESKNTQLAVMIASMTILKVLEQESGKSIEVLCDCVAGHSLGEYSALCAAKAITLQDTAKLLDVRGQAFDMASQLKNGKMLSLICATEEQIKKIIEKTTKDGKICQIANDNSSGQIVLSGDETAIDEAEQLSKELQVKKAIKLNTSGAFHSKLMEPAIEPMKNILDEIKINRSLIPVIANYTADFEQDDTLIIKTNLLNQIINTVKWRQSIDLAKNRGVKQFVEIGASKVLGKMNTRANPDVESYSIDSIDALKKFIAIL